MSMRSACLISHNNHTVAKNEIYNELESSRRNLKGFETVNIYSALS